MRAGGLNKQISIYALASTQSTVSGEILNSYTTWLDNVWAGYERLSGSEEYIGEERQLVETARFKIRYSTGINQTKRIVYNSRNYEILDVENVGDRNKELLITARYIE